MVGRTNGGRPSPEPIAIVGSSCRFPGGATSPSKLWELLKEPRDVVEKIPPSRFDISAFYHTDSQHHGSTNTQYAYLLQDDPRAFDSDFFNINPREAEAMDPQQRCLLEAVYEGVESAGLSISQLRGSLTGVFVGAMGFDYQHVAMRGLESLPQYYATGGSMAILANRVSYFYDWRGPSVALDTACSSSLVALHQAVLSLRSGEVDMAVAAGVNLILGPENFIAYSKLNMLSPNGRSYMWDASADGYTRGEGFAAVVLKTLSQALADGDHIECLIRETGVNSDGRTPGITMPDASAQSRLIQDTYARCGLDPTNPLDRPQYFEAHGTGTPAGDPVEARAIHDAFFSGRSDHPADQKLYVGSVKTVLGHTEGSAGLAGLIKASLAVQHGQIPGNLHLRDLNPKIKPFSKRLHVPTKLTPWPALETNRPRRVSVNSFGFGGTNAHVIIEGWEPAISEQDHASISITPGLFVLSANSAQALAAKSAALATYVSTHPGVDLNQLARTLFQRAEFQFRTAVSATSSVQLAEKLEAKVEALKKSPRLQFIPDNLPPRILGVFTGQGAQWPTMGKDLYDVSAVFRRSMDDLQRSLDELPHGERPDWSLMNELSAAAQTSRVGVAAISQPLCTALQIALVDVLRAAGVHFAAVVGHSSGEICAAYAAGYLKAYDAIRIAYYRGLHSYLAQAPDGNRGKMMAVGMSLEQATVFCAQFNGGSALQVAASNSPTSCTLAGDANAVNEAKIQLDQDNIFARALAVDTAYHSRHMQPCAAPYLASLQKCKISPVGKPAGRNGEVAWYSSVWGVNGRSRSFDDEQGIKLLQGQYWVDNLTNTVQFSQALSRALTEESFPLDIALEVGPHPALKGPSCEVIKSLTGVSMPYEGVLKRGEGAVEALANGLGSLFVTFPSQRPIITFDGIQRIFSNHKILSGRGIANVKTRHSPILKDLPTYPWDHDGIIWRESRASRNFRSKQGQSRHELLGFPVVLGEHGGQREVHWHQVFKLNEVPWVRDHIVQGEVLFPATGYLTMAYEAAVRLLEDPQAARLIELYDNEIVKAMSPQEDSPGTELLFTIRVTKQSTSCILADVACYSGDVSVAKLDSPMPGFVAHYTGRVRVWLGTPSENALPLRQEPLLPMINLSTESFYSYLSTVGYDYATHFRVTTIDRRLDHAVITVPTTPQPSSIRNAAMHPTALDTAIQGILAACSFPEDGRLGTVYLPTSIDSVRINMVEPPHGNIMADSFLGFADTKALTGDVDLFSAKNSVVQVQMRGVHWTALNNGGENRWIYAAQSWTRDPAYGIEPSQATKISTKDEKLRTLLVRTAFFYLRKLKERIKQSELLLMGKHRKHMMKWIREHLFPQIEAGKILDIEPGWDSDTLEDVQKWSAEYLDAGNNDMRLLHAVGSRLPAIARGTMPALQVMMEDSMLERLYTEGVGFADGNIDLEILVKQISRQHPRMKIVEVGAGTGGTTRAVLSALGDHYTSYTYTDISSGFFELAAAKSKFGQHLARLSFKKLDIEKNPVEQGFEEGSFDMVVASNCLHATRSLKETVQHCRRLLRPGGYLVLLEITRDHLPIQLIMGTLPGWFLGVEEGRVWAPTISIGEWNTLLLANGFSGVDCSSTPSFCSVLVSQAVDDTVKSLRDPLSPVGKSTALPLADQIIVIGSNNIVQKSQALLVRSVGASVRCCNQLDGIEIPFGAVVLCLADLDGPVFDTMTEARFQGMQTVFKNASVVLWATTGAESGKQPLASITVGLGTTLQAERSELRTQFLDTDEPQSIDPGMLVTLLLRLTWTPPSNSNEVLWIHEPYLTLKQGVLYFPRVEALDASKHQPSASMRKVTQRTRLGLPDTVVEIAKRDNEPPALLGRQVGSGINLGEQQAQVTASSFKAIVRGSSRGALAYVVIGRNTTSDTKIVGLPQTSSSTIGFDNDQILHSWSSADHAKDAARLVHFIRRALAQQLLRNVKGPVWIHGASHDLSKAIAHAAEQHNLTIFQTTSDMTANAHDGRLFIHPFINVRDLQSLRPKVVQTFINLKPTQNNELSTFLKASLLSSAFHLAVPEDSLVIDLSHDDLSELASKHFGNVTTNDDHDDGSCAANLVVTLDDITSARTASDNLDQAIVIDWCASEQVTAVVPSIEHNGLFSEDKTYVLFGMTGDVGISIAVWMVDHGARYVVLTSRSPRVPPGVFEFIAQKRATLRTVAADVTDMQSLEAAIADIRSIMPPIGGIINGAMVLRDQLFADMPWADFEAVLAPKVAGTRNLNEIFGTSEKALEFFIVLSSVTSLVGTIGQSAYSAANHYVSSLVRQRRARGLPGSVVVIGFLTGLGYIFRSNQAHLTAIEKSLLPHLERQGETDLHTILAEAIVCGRAESGLPAELITGMKQTFEGAWHDDPRLSCYLVPAGMRQEATDVEKAGGKAKVAAQLAAASDHKEAQEILEQCFTQSLGDLLQLDPNMISKDVTVANLGVDSLVSVQIREWFLKELGVKVPVLKIMSTNHTLSRLCEDAFIGWHKMQTESSGSAGVVTSRQEEQMDWSKEVSNLIDGIELLAPPGNTLSSDKPRAHDRRMVLTGCTGFLGTHIIQSLVADSSVSEVHCLCIRGRHVRVESDKVREYKGDLTKPLLGLSMHDFARLSQLADIIIHVGADVNHLKSYEGMRAANVVSTQILLAMATPRYVPVHIVSSSSVAMLQKDSNELLEVPPSAIKPPTDAQSLMKNAIGYAASKWMGEMLLERAAAKTNGVPTVVHRFPNIMGPDAPEEIPLVALDRYCTKMRAVPALDPKLWIGELDIIEVDNVMPEFLAKTFAHEKSFAVHNYCSTNRYLLSDLAGMYKRKLGGNIAVLPTVTWMKKAVAMGMPKGVEVTFTGHEEVFVSPVLRKGKN